MNFHTMHHPFNLILICNYINWACTIKSHRIILINFLNRIFGHFVVSIMLITSMKLILNEIYEFNINKKNIIYIHMGAFEVSGWEDMVCDTQKCKFLSS